MSVTPTSTASTSSWSPPSGWVGNLSAQQQKALDEFRSLLKSENLFVEERGDDTTLLRFLRARKFDVKLARDMWATSEKWRKDFGTDDLFKNGFEFPERAEVDKYYPQYYHKTDKDGRPIYIEQLGTLDVNALYKVTTEERQLRRLVWEYERLVRKRLPACAEAAGHPVEASCTILDLKGVGIGQFWKVKDYVAQATHIGQNYYPEIMGRFYIINANLLFSTIWAVIKGWLDPATVQKVTILDSGYKDKLLEGIPAANLPVEFQGECKCEGGCSLSDAGPWKR